MLATLTRCGQLQFAIGRIFISFDFITNIFVMFVMPFDDSPIMISKKKYTKVMLNNISINIDYNYLT